jgi:hypothetical protein
MKIFRSAFALCLAALLPNAVLAQSATGGIIGKAPPGTVVVVHGEAIGIDRQVTSTGRGHFKADRLPPGVYAVRVGPQAEPVYVRVRAGVNVRVP